MGGEDLWLIIVFRNHQVGHKERLHLQLWHTYNERDFPYNEKAAYNPNRPWNRKGLWQPLYACRGIFTKGDWIQPLFPRRKEFYSEQQHVAFDLLIQQKNAGSEWPELTQIYPPKFESKSEDEIQR
ncbi:hypothetical protein PFISCL1PPCAC_21253 [Pristionchus fissidentatus]|uniref:Uncharacterized protein n=1 Tax=Pristionchus fissidentatus TaxID=1538716 RepID=A0AAV5WCF7_9BILA|nr:hypothetical protein PFISCL1PPCAC_21253 [Pristionchus fissidentatus]